MDLNFKKGYGAIDCLKKLNSLQDLFFKGESQLYEHLDLNAHNASGETFLTFTCKYALKSYSETKGYTIDLPIMVAVNAFNLIELNEAFIQSLVSETIRQSAMDNTLNHIIVSLRENNLNYFNFIWCNASNKSLLIDIIEEKFCCLLSEEEVRAYREKMKLEKIVTNSYTKTLHKI